VRALVGRVLPAAAWAVPLLVVVQAVLVGQAQFGGAPGLVTTHGIVGNVTFLAAAVALGAALLARRPGRVLLPLFIGALLLFAQTGLGYVGHRTGLALASSVHVGLGVALTVVTTLGAVRAAAVGATR
jgi:hypothetical protein